MRFLLTCFTIFSLIFLHLATATYQNPHPFPSKGPWFEGWYTRLVDSTNGRSFALINALMLNNRQETIGYLAIMHAANNSSQPMEVFESFPETPNITDCYFQPISSEPDRKSPPCFRWAAGGCNNSYKGSRTDCEGYVMSNENFTVFEFTSYETQSDGTIKGASLKLSLGNITPWDDSGFGPMGVAIKVPYLGLYWFVYSLGTQTEYEYSTFEMTKSGEAILTNQLTGQALAHQEKNWGDTFPSAWIWAQGVSEDNTVHFALAGGPKGLPLVPFIKPVLWLVGYRSPKVGSWDFDPQHIDTVFVPSVDACSGHFTLTVKNLVRKLIIDIQANPETFNECLYGPSENGFAPMCLESFVAEANVTAYERKGLTWELIETNILPMSALEFGGDYTCKPCSSAYVN